MDPCCICMLTHCSGLFGILKKILFLLQKKRLTLEFTSSENANSPVHSDVGSKTNLLRDSVTPSHVTDHVIDSANHDQSENVVVNNGASVVSPDHVELQEQDEPELHTVSITVHVGLKSENTELQFFQTFGSESA